MKKPHIVKTRVADENNVVHTVVGGNGSHCQTPCEECPWVKANDGKFPAEAFRISAHTAYDMAGSTFACHMRGPKAPTTCAGFLLRGADDNLKVRMLRADKKLLDVQEDGRPLHESYAKMAIANGVSPKDPVILPCMPEARQREDAARRKARRRRLSLV